MLRRQHRLACALLALMTLVAPALAHGQAGTPEPTGPDFEAILTADAKVIPAIKGALKDGRAFAEPAAFGDLTADGTSDAVVLVSTPGAVAAYILSADGARGGKLRVIHRSQSLYRAVVRVGRSALVVITPDYARGDDVCCPAARLERTYVYDRRAKLFRRTASQRLVRAAG